MRELVKGIGISYVQSQSFLSVSPIKAKGTDLEGVRTAETTTKRGVRWLNES